MITLTRSQTIPLWLAISAIVVSSLMFQHPTFAIDAPGEEHILYEVARPELIEARLKAIGDKAEGLLDGAGIAYARPDGGDRAVEVQIGNAADVERAKAALTELLAPVSTEANAVSEFSLEEPEPRLLRYALTDAGIDYRVDAAAAASIEIIKHRIRDLGFGEALVERLGADRIQVKLAGVRDLLRLAGMVGETGRFTFRKVDRSVPVEEAISGRVPAGSSLLNSIGNGPPPYLVEDRIIVSDDNVVDAQPIVDHLTNEPVIAFRLDSTGARLFEQWTQENVGEMVAIIVDEQVISAPYIREPILGSGEIAGDFTTQTAKELAAFLRAGSIPAKLNVIEIKTKPAAP